MFDLNDLYFFTLVVEHGGFSAAGRAIGVPKSKLSRRVAALEGRLGVRLIQRSPRQFSVTEVGREFYIHCSAMLVEAEAAVEAIEQVRSEPRGVVRVSCPVTLMNFQFGALFARFLARYPQVDLHLESTNRRVDVVSEGFDVAIRVRSPPLDSTDLVMRRLDESTQCLVASPELVAEPLANPSDLTGFPGLASGPPHRRHEWTLENSDGRTAAVSFAPRLVTDDMAALREAALAGVGVVQLPTIMVWNHVGAGKLVSLLPDWRPAAGIVHAVFPSRRGLLPSVRELLDFLASECASARRSMRELP